MEQLRTILLKGYAVVAIVNPLHYWEATNPMLDFYLDLQRRQGTTGANHVVWILDANDTFVYINDTALPNGAGLRVSLPDFLRAWGASGNAALVVERLLPVLDTDQDGVADHAQDRDWDGFRVGVGPDMDCDDGNPNIHPGRVDDLEIAYNGIDENCDGVDVVDRDSDGYAAEEARGGDCDDENPLIYPGAPDPPYDRTDSACDGDDGEWDVDHDGVPQAQDCDDRNPAIAPGRPELCDSLDNDCDTLIDDRDPDVNPDTQQVFYADGDGDGFGSLIRIIRSCDGRSGIVKQGGDCDDLAGGVFPGAEEVCDGVDQDCDGTPDNIPDDSQMNGSELCFRDADGDGVGDSGTSRKMCQCTGGWTSAMSGLHDCDDNNSATIQCVK
jgi:hypothetical protein